MECMLGDVKYECSACGKPVGVEFKFPIGLDLDQIVFVIPCQMCLEDAEAEGYELGVEETLEV